MAQPQKLQGYEFYNKVLKNAKYILAPMVDQSEYSWRVLSRRYGAQVCYTPMLHAKMFCEDSNKQYRKDVWSTGKDDRPLIVQFCANDPDILLKAALKIQNDCDGVDLNLGCPQHIARKGHYVNTLHKNLSVPVTAKIRIFPDVEKTLRYAKMIESAGAQLLAVHGRIRDQKELKIPVFANGNILYFEDIQNCIDITGVDGIMSAEGNLYNPAIFAGINPPVWQMSAEYLEICKTISTRLTCIRGHLFKIYKPALPFHVDLREKLGKANSFEEICSISEELNKRLMKTAAENDENIDIRKDENGYKTFPHWICQPCIRPLSDSNEAN
ncbi:11916_t:CDS:2 [Entrophospora sp. SA101]|nr:11916_t:CDS:2 [Entrophospora sp. SA101]CAJ0848633.1 17807_t:CDS:2 [Entrophospora sp. SA101]